MKLISPTLEFNQEATPGGIANTIQSLEERDDPFVILEQNELTYIQTLWTPDGFSLEYQEGNTDHHFISKSLLTKDQVISCFEAYLSDDSSWKDTTEFKKKTVRGILYKLGWSIGQFVGDLERGFHKT